MMCDAYNLEYEKLKKLLVDLLEIENDTPVEEINQDFISNWDSSMHLNIIMEIESQFKVSFNIEDIIKMRSLEEIFYYLEQKIR